MRRLLLIAALVAAAAVGVAAASAIMPTAGNETLNGPDALQPDGNGATPGPTVADPAGRQRLAVRVYRSKAGLTCPEAARTDGDNFGQIDAAGKFHSNGVQAGGACVDLGKAPMSVTIDKHAAVGELAAYALVFGAVSPQIRSLTITLGGRARPVPVTNGSYLAVTTIEELVGGSVDSTSQDGTIKSYALSPPIAAP